MVATPIQLMSLRHGAPIRRLGNSRQHTRSHGAMIENQNQEIDRWMLRLAHERAAQYGRSSKEDTLDLIKCIIEWRGRVSIVTEADRFYASETLELDADNAKALLDLYEIIGPGAGYVPPTDPDDPQGGVLDESTLDRGGSTSDWLPKLTSTQDEVDDIVLRILGPNFKLPGKPGDDDEEGGDELISLDINLGFSVSPIELSSDSPGGGVSGGGGRSKKKKKKKKWVPPSPIEPSWVVETQDKHVIRLAVSHEGLTGSLPQSARRLVYLERLELPALRPWFDPEAAHELIPKHLRPKLALDLMATSTLGYLPALKLLNLHGNLLTGGLPDALGNLSNLEELDLSRNRFTGSVPGGLGKLTKLTCLDVSNCRLDGGLDPLFLRGATALEVLNCGGNLLCGPLPGEDLARLTNLRELDLSENKLTGLLAVELPNRLRKCERFILCHNFLRGKLPSTLMDLTSCTEVDLSFNRFNGRLPLSLAVLKSTLTYVDVSNNDWGDDERDELHEFLEGKLHRAAPNIYV